ncbi:abortive infection family protein [Cognatilysobacter segetis]|uniref:abortive infection family protein n=1 Tax=Cognatilysobacter segetis TaxID=2492394 RepID=UPI0010615045|nr:abortive infection family protein [Lysobacter segetis]
MSDLTSRERRKLEELLGMDSGYVLNFSDRTYTDFFDEFVGRNIDDERYRFNGGSKAKRMRAFWQVEPNGVVAKCLVELLEHARSAGIVTRDEALVGECRAIITRLSLDKPVADIEAISAAEDERDFDLVAKEARESIERNQPEAGLDRLHTFLVKFVRYLCEQHGLQVTRDMPLNGIFGAYVKRLKDEGSLGSDMAERILKSSISNLEYFNHVRNNHTLAHDNPVLGYDEALLIFSHVASTVRFIKALEERIRLTKAPEKEPWEIDIPF